MTSIKQENKPTIVFQVHVKLSQTEEQLTLDVNLNDTILTLKSKIQNQVVAVPVAKFDLIYNGEALKNSRSLSSYTIHSGSNLCAIFPVENTMQINIRVVLEDRRKIKLRVKSWYTVENVKDMVESMEGIAADKQRLYGRSGEILENQKSLEDLMMSPGYTLDMFYGLRIYVRNLISGSSSKYEVRESDTIADLRKKVGKSSPFLDKNGRQLEGSYTLADYNIKNEDTIYV